MRRKIKLWRTRCARGWKLRAIRCWIAPRDIVAGTSYGEAIIDAIHGAKVMVLVFSSNANASGHIPKEVERAVSNGVAILPFRIEDVAPGKSLDYFIGSVHWLDAMTPPMEKHLDALAATVHKLIPEKAGEPGPGASPSGLSGWDCDVAARRGGDGSRSWCREDDAHHGNQCDSVCGPGCEWRRIIREEDLDWRRGGGGVVGAVSTIFSHSGGDSGSSSATGPDAPGATNPGGWWRCGERSDMLVEEKVWRRRPKTAPRDHQP